MLITSEPNCSLLWNFLVFCDSFANLSIATSAAGVAPKLDPKTMASIDDRPRINQTMVRQLRPSYGTDVDRASHKRRRCTRLLIVKHLSQAIVPTENTMKFIIKSRNHHTSKWTQTPTIYKSTPLPSFRSSVWEREKWNVCSLVNLCLCLRNTTYSERIAICCRRLGSFCNINGFVWCVTPCTEKSSNSYENRMYSSTKNIQQYLC